MGQNIIVAVVWYDVIGRILLHFPYIHSRLDRLMLLWDRLYTSWPAFQEMFSDEAGIVNVMHHDRRSSIDKTWSTCDLSQAMWIDAHIIGPCSFQPSTVRTLHLVIYTHGTLQQKMRYMGRRRQTICAQSSLVPGLWIQHILKLVEFPCSAILWQLWTLAFSFFQLFRIILGWVKSLQIDAVLKPDTFCRTS